MRASCSLGLKRWTPGVKDSHGNPVETWAPAVDWPVYAVAPSTSDEPDPDRRAVVTNLTVLAPPGTYPGPHDLVEIPSSLSPEWAGDWQVDGEVGDYTHGPFGYRPGGSVVLKRAEG